MSMEINVLFSGALPSKAALEGALQELGFPLTIEPADGSLEDQSGFMPMGWRGKRTGVEFDVFDGRDAIDEFEVDGIDPRFDRSANFRWGGDFDECVCALCGAAALAKLVNGVVLDDGGDLLSVERATEQARVVFDNVASGKYETGT